MAIELRVRNGESAPEFRDHVERRLGFALGRFGGRVSRVTVSLEDLNGPRGGVDQCCRIAVSLVPSGKVIAEATDLDAVVAVNRAAKRIARRVRNEFDRRRTTRKLSSPSGPDSLEV